MPYPVDNRTSPSTFYSNIKSSESPSTPNSYVSLSDTSQSPESVSHSFHQNNKHDWSKTLDTLRQWSTRTYKFTRQLFQERIDQTLRTQDFELEQKIEVFRETKRHYEDLLKKSHQMILHFVGLLQTQRSLSQSFIELQKISIITTNDLNEQFIRNGQCQNIIAHNGESLLNSMNSFVQTLQTLTTKTMEDTLMTIKAYEKARIEYDAYRNDYETIITRNHTGGINLTNSEKLIEKQYYHFKERYDKLKSDVTVKLRLLDDNRVKVMQEQLILFYKAIFNYFSMTQQQLY